MHIQISRISVVFSTLLAIIGLLSSFSSVSAQTVLQFNNDLYWNMAPVSNEVKLLQQFLKDQGFYSSVINGKYLTQTYNAVVKFQNANSISPATGYFGPDTRAKANAILRAQATTQNNVTTTQTNTNLANVVTTTTAVATVPTTTTTTTNTTSNLIYNPSLEEANGTQPNRWIAGKWGTNTSVFTYPTGGFDGARSASLTVTGYVDGDAKWYFEDVPVIAGKQYTFSEYYKSNVVTNVTIRWTKTDGTKVYQSLGNPVATTNWTQRVSTFTVPTGVVKMTIFHILKSNGTLSIDNYKLTSTSVTTTQTSTTSVATTTTSSTLTPVDATVTAWGNWTPITAWTSCSVNTQTRTEERTRTIINGPVNGGSVPVLRETRTVSQSCGTIATTTSLLNFTTKEWGVYNGWADDGLSSFENAVGKQAKYRAVFIHWGNESAFPMKWKTSIADTGKTLVIFWEATNYNVGTVNQTAYNYDSVLNGNWDSYFTQFAKDAKAYGGEVILIPFSEMNGDWFPWAITQNNNSPQKHIDAWRRIRNIFKDVPNVKFGWAPNQVSVPNTTINQFENFYPGDAYVDYVGLDGFNFGTPWLTFDELFAKPLAKMKVYKKPIYIFSFASAAGTLKDEWITDALKVQMYRHPEIKGWIWFNENKERDWRVNVDPIALNAFKAALP